MKALILASGLGSRLSPLTDKIPKPLVEVNGVSMLSRILNSLIMNNINEAIITTGHLGDVLVNFVRQNFPTMKITFVHNAEYKATNAIYSMWLAKEHCLGDDILYFHSDIFYDNHLIKKLLRKKYSSCLVHKNRVSDKDFNAKIVEGNVREIGVNVVGDKIRFCLPVIKVMKNDVDKWFCKIDEYINSGKNNCYAETALNEILNSISLKPVFFGTGEIGMEIDDFEDLELLKKILG